VAFSRRPVAQHSSCYNCSNVPEGISKGAEDTMGISIEVIESAGSLIPNLRIVSPTVICGGQPEEGGLRKLKEAGVRTVLDLRQSQYESMSCNRLPQSAASNHRNIMSCEEKLVSSLAMRYVHLPIDVFADLPANHISEFLRIVRDTDSCPIFMHCVYGLDRTGLMIGIYRMACQGRDIDSAYREMLECGFDPELSCLTDAFYKWAMTLGAAFPDS
jgi:hypothetical protein